MYHVVFEMAIGIIFVFLVYSLLASAIHEVFAAMAAQRGRMLLRGIQKMLNGESIYWWHNAGRIFGRRDRHRRHEGSLAQAFRQHTLFRRLSKNDKPAYLSDTQFSNILVDVLHHHGKPSGEPVLYEPRTFTTVSAGLEKVIAELDRRIGDTDCPNRDKKCYQTRKRELQEIFSVMLDQANGDLQRLRALLENWYNEMMDRVSGWYKKQTHQILFVIGLGLVVLFNVDTIAIINMLSKDRKSREALVSMAQSYIENYPAADSPSAQLSGDQAMIANSVIREAYEDARRNAEGVNSILGLGWSRERDSLIPWWKKTFGLIITALAISLGATFWFDLLNKLVNLRMAGKTPHDREKSVTVKAKSTVQLNQKPPVDAEG